MDPCRIPRPIRVPHPRRQAPPPLSATIGDLPRRQTVNVYGLPGVAHHLVVVNCLHTDDPERIERAYRELRSPIRPHIWRMFATPDPDSDLVGYLEARWWAGLDAVTLALILRMEAAGLSYPWPHGRTAGPILTPSR